MRPSAHTPTTTSVPSVCTRVTVSQPGPMIVKRISTPWMPYQNRSGWCGSSVHGLARRAAADLADRRLAAAGRLEPRGEPQRGTGEAAARSSPWPAGRSPGTSASEPAIGLSMNSGLPAAITGRACSRCGRPSTLSSSTTSTFLSSSSIESTISTPFAAELLGVLLHAVAAGGHVRAAARDRRPRRARRPGRPRPSGSLSTSVKAIDVRRVEPDDARRGSASRSAAAARRETGRSAEGRRQSRNCYGCRA